MNIYSSLFIFQFLCILFISMIKFYNILSGGKQPKDRERGFFPYDMRASFMMFVLTLLFYGIGFVISIYGFAEQLYLILFKFEMFLFLPLNTLFFIVEIIFQLKDTAFARIEAHKSNDKNVSFFSR